MREIVHYILIVLIVTPSLVCAMPCSKNDLDSQNAVEQTCLDHKPEPTQQNRVVTGEIMLLIDCMNLDLQQTQSNIQIEKPDNNTFLSIAWFFYDDLLYRLNYVEALKIRRPPSWIYDIRLSPPLILTTQRFRI